MASNKNQKKPIPPEDITVALQGLAQLLGETNLKDLVSDVQSLKFDNERIVKPALKDIREILGRDIYAPKTEVAELKADVEKLKEELAKEKERTRNYAIVEKVVFGLVGVVLLAVVGALVGLVVLQRSS